MYGALQNLIYPLDLFTFLPCCNQKLQCLIGILWNRPTQAQFDWIEYLWTSVCYRLSTGFRFERFLSHPNTWLFFDLKHFIVALAVCLESEGEHFPQQHSVLQSNMTFTEILLYLSLLSTLSSFRLKGEGSKDNFSVNRFSHQSWGPKLSRLLLINFLLVWPGSEPPCFGGFAVMPFSLHF